ncbi:hypothetical protein [Herbaspirillum huttiense]|uniref:Ig-like domain-containing protein n=1 Tax=Herbaspirillum huttiense subsp. lycopersici TaxID=3074428 RepID=A0ABU2EFT8_9BURK|nr:hypothetical protein [Herbaspirillum huttiense]MDR9847004.1 hypothetical protein [Herbaspirillum huttiense SE1]
MLYVRKYFATGSPTDPLMEIEYSPTRLLITYDKVPLSLDFAALKDRSDWGDFTHYIVTGDLPTAIVNSPLANPFGIISYFPLTALNKGKTPNYVSGLVGRSLLAHVFVPHAGVSSFEECNVMVATTGSVKSNVPFLEIENSRADWTIPKYDMKITGPAKLSTGQTGTFNLQFLGFDGKPAKAPALVYVETTAGYLPLARVQLDENGQGSFKVRADLIDPGTTFKVKVGFKYFSGLAETVVEVTP